MPQRGETKPGDTCGRCGLRRATRELEERGVVIPLCDDCYWGEKSEDAVSRRQAEQEQLA